MDRLVNTKSPIYGKIPLSSAQDKGIFLVRVSKAKCNSAEHSGKVHRFA